MIVHVRWLVVACLAACSATVERDRAPASPRATAHPVIAPVEPLAPPITGTHGAAIAMFALATEGDAVISADEHGAIRVWPTLDGTREPVVVHTGMPRQLAIAHDGDGLLVAILDVARGLELIRLDRDGRVRERAMAGGEAIADVVLVEQEAIVLRVDQSIERIAPSGETRARLLPEAGTRIVRLVKAGDRVLAVGEAGPRRFVRWIEPGARAWGAMLGKLAFDPARPMAVSPDRKYLLANELGIATLIDLETGKASATCSKRSAAPRKIALGFIDADTIACAEEGHLVWWSIASAKELGHADAPVIDEALDVAARDVVVSRSSHDLVLRRRDGAKQLGYGVRAMTARYSPTAISLAADHRSVIVDASLKARKIVEHPLDDAVLPLDAELGIAISAPASSTNDAWGWSRSLSVFDFTRGAPHQHLQGRTSDSLVFERSTGLLATIDGAQTHLLRYDPMTHTFGPPIDIDADGVIHRITLLDPTLANGLVALTLEERLSSVVFGEIDGRDLGGTSIKTRRVYRVLGDLLAVDRAGRIYTLDTHGRVNVQRGEGPRKELPITGATSIVPDADGSRLVVETRGQLSLYRADGTHVWTVPSRGVRQVRWVGNDLVGSFADSLAKYDLATGELAARQCGWDFGLHEVKVAVSPSLENVCDAD